ncbi:hypothetical protein PENANT_c016G10046 [Penicillium antarcticum]|uniref:Uncharacterized protein n=1 Tax=Penicillium antarcticum TaxID=416450 RepID=A0A1V6Q2X5_9EURO|nr:hypothetical protein PENANT_c016G10046 [Penicillium antarcticum]
MRFTLFTVFAFASLGLATIPAGGTCKPDGSMGICASGLCVKEASAATGKCK